MSVKPLFLFATGIENSYLTIEGGRVRVDQMEKCGHYRHWRLDFDLAHRRLDDAVFAAYGWEPDLSDEEMLESCW